MNWCSREKGMRTRTHLLMGVLVTVAGLLLVGCGKAKAPAPVDPHSIDGVMQALVQHAGLLDDAAKRKDFKYVHDFSYYVKNLAQALYSKLDDGQKEQSKNLFTELVKVANQLDASSGRRHEENTQSGTARLREILTELEAQLRPGKKTDMGAAEQRRTEVKRVELAAEMDVSAQSGKPI